MISRTPTMQEVLNLLVERASRDLRVGMPGVVTEYDATKQLASVQPQIAGLFELDTGELENVRLPVLTNVPVIFPGAGGFRITFPVVAGDTVWVMFSDRSLDAWLDQGGQTAPADRKSHHLSDAVCIPGLHPNNAPWAGAEAGVITLGSNAGAADFVALASLVLDELNKIKDAFNGHQHADPVSGLSGGPQHLLVPTSYTPAAVASATVKIKG